MITAIIQGVALAFLVGDFVYHRLRQKSDNTRTQSQINLPRTEAGAPMPMVIGKCRARRPILAWQSRPQYGTNGFAPAEFQMNMFFIIGVGMADGDGTNVVHGMWVGDTRCTWQLATGPLDSTQTGDGDFETVIIVQQPIPDPLGGSVPLEAFRGHVETLNGKPTQVLVDDGGAATTYAGARMLGIPDDVPGYRGYISAFLHNEAGDGFGQWRIGETSSVPSYSFEVSSYSPTSGYPATGVYVKVGEDGNPINALYDFYVAKLAKIGLNASVIDLASWAAAAMTCWTEGCGYSRYIDDARDLDDLIQEVLQVIDGALRENPYTGKIEIKLIRPDFNPNLIAHVTKHNCDTVKNFAFGGWVNVANKVNVAFSARDKNYNTDVEPASNPANAVRQDGQLNEVTLSYPGICDRTQAKNTAARELAALSVPIMKMSLMVDSVEFKNVRQGDAVKVTLSRPPVSGLIFRVADVDLGSIDDGKIRLDLITDTSSYVKPGENPEPTDFGSHDHGHVPGRRAL